VITGLQGTRQALAVSLGEPAGIGPELILRAWCAARDRCDIPPFLVTGDAAFLTKTAGLLSLRVPVVACAAEAAAALFPRALPVIDLGNKITAEPGAPTTANAAAVIASIERAVGLVRKGICAGLVTAPIAKHVLQGEGFRHPGHTEYLGQLATRLWRENFVPVMMLWSSDLAVVPVTVHIPLAEVPRRLSTALIVATGRVVARDISSRFGIAMPRLAVTGLNPHAGENGMLGFEDQTIVAPAIEQLRAQGIMASGPHPADTMFHARVRQTYDVALAMYHDQALVPIKTIAFNEAVNVTLGLPFIRTSPDHGTAFDIAGKGVARDASFIAALVLAGRLTHAKHVAPAK
jgi:4-hydroxythreonine-4-phosphate dehydrogenase